MPKATFVPNFVSFAASVAELAHGKNVYSITHSRNHAAYLMLALQKMTYTQLPESTGHQEAYFRDITAAGLFRA